MKKKLNAVWLRTAEAEEISKRDYWKIKNEIAEREKDMADIKKKTYRVIQPKCKFSDPYYFCCRWSNPEIL